MKQTTARTALAAGIGLWLAGTGGLLMAQGDTHVIEPARLESRIQTTYELSPHLRDTRLEVGVDAAGIATLSGVVADAVDKELAGQIALGVDGIRKVVNDIEIRDDYVVDTRASERSFGTRVDDFSTSSVVKSKLLWSKHIDGMDIDVATLDGEVTLKGAARSGAARELAGNIARNTSGVRSVDNQLEIISDDAVQAADGSGPGAEEGNGAIVSDSWITSKLLSTYLYSSNLESADIDVSTSQGVVTLAGELQSGAEKELAIELANNIRGVVSVNSEGLLLAGK